MTYYTTFIEQPSTRLVPTVEYSLDSTQYARPRQFLRSIRLRPRPSIMTMSLPHFRAPTLPSIETSACRPRQTATGRSDEDECSREGSRRLESDPKPSVVTVSFVACNIYSQPHFVRSLSWTARRRRRKLPITPITAPKTAINSRSRNNTGQNWRLGRNR
jgi:hypothetical protein